MVACPLTLVLPGALIFRNPLATKPFQLLRVEPETARAVAVLARVLGPVAVVREDAA